MLLRPPFIKEEDVQSHSQNGISNFDRQPSVKSSSKNKKKQSSLGMRKTNMIGMYNQQSNANVPNYDSDNGSVHSVNSRKSKGRAKESTLAIGKKQPAYQNPNQNSAYSIKNQNDRQDYEIFKLDSDEDNKSIGSHVSKNSKKNIVKENSLGKNRNSRVNVQLNYYYNQKQNEREDNTPPKTYYLEQESKVQTVRLNQNVEPVAQPLKYNQVLKGATLNRNPEVGKRRTEQAMPKQTSSPFEQIVLKRQSDDEEPVYRLKEPQQNYRNQNQGMNFFGHRPTQNKLAQQQNPFGQKNAFVQKGKSQAQIQTQAKKIKVDLQQSSTIQPQMISTKSVTKSVRRNKIFDNDNNSISNSSNIMSSRTNMEGSFQRSRSKSKSKLGELLKQSRQKKQLANSKQITTQPTRVLSPTHNKTNIIQNNQSKPFGIKQTQESVNNFVQINKSNLVSVTTLNEQSRMPSKKLGQNPVKMEPIKRKSIENQTFDMGQSNFQLNLSASHKIAQPSALKGDSVHFNFQPEKKKGLSITSKDKPSSENKSVESKKHLDRLMKKCQQNQEFLAKSILSNNSELKTSQKSNLNQVPSPFVNKKQEALNRPFQKIKEQQIEEQEPAWHQLVKNDPVFQIKQVERKQIRRPSEEQIKISQRPKLQQKKPSQPFKTFQNPRQQNLPQTPMNRLRQEQNNVNLRMQQQIQQRNQPKQNLVQQKNRVLANLQRKAKIQKEKQIILKNGFQQSPKQEQMRQYKPERVQQNYTSAPLQQNQPQYIKEQVQTSSLSHELSLSQNGSQRSNSTKKNKKKQSSLNIMKKHKVQVRDQSPRGEESFYEEKPRSPKKYQIEEKQQQKVYEPQISSRMQLSRPNAEYKKPNLISFQQSDTEEEKIKSKTDLNFYNYGDASQKSMRPPSSKPPLSRKSGHSSSKSKSKAKESTLNINMVKKQNKMTKNRVEGNLKPEPKKKKTLLDIAQDKEYEGSGYGGSDSQCSFNSRESFGSVNSRGSRKSSTSKKESTLPITIKNKATTMNNFRPSLNKIASTTSQVQIYQNDSQSTYSNLPDQSQRRSSRGRQRQRYPQEMQQRTIVSKDTYFIDERGRLVKQDLIIRGNKVYGQSTEKSAEQMAKERMRRSRQHHRSRSKSRDGSRSRMSKKNSTSNFDQSGYNSGSSSNYFNPTQSNYGSQYGMQKPNLYIEEFVKPIQQPIRTTAQNYKFQKPVANQRKIQRQFYENDQQQYDNYYQDEEEEPVKNITLNELFGRNQKQPSNNSKPNNYQNNYQNNVYANKNQSSKYGANSRYNGQNGQQSAMRQSGRKKSLSRTQKTFYNR